MGLVQCCWLPPSLATHKTYTHTQWSYGQWTINNWPTNEQLTELHRMHANIWNLEYGILRCKWWWVAQWVVCGHTQFMWPLSLSLSLFRCLHFRRIVYGVCMAYGYKTSFEIKIGQNEIPKGRAGEWAERNRTERKLHVITNNKPVKWNRLAIMYDTLSVFQLIQTVI